MAEYSKGDNKGYIANALTGGSGESECITEKSIGRGQKINTAYAMDNVDLAMEVKNAMGGKYAGSDTNLSHSLSGASTVGADDIGASGKVKHNYSD